MFLFNWVNQEDLMIFKLLDPFLEFVIHASQDELDLVLNGRPKIKEGLLLPSSLFDDFDKPNLSPHYWLIVIYKILLHVINLGSVPQIPSKDIFSLRLIVNRCEYEIELSTNIYRNIVQSPLLHISSLLTYLFPPIQLQPPCMVLFLHPLQPLLPLILISGEQYFKIPGISQDLEDSLGSLYFDKLCSPHTLQLLLCMLPYISFVELEESLHHIIFINRLLLVQGFILLLISLMHEPNQTIQLPLVPPYLSIGFNIIHHTLPIDRPLLPPSPPDLL